jgi:hypothetical protein
MPQMGCTARGRCSSTDGRSWRATGVSLAGQAVDLAPLPERLPRRRRGPARCPCWPSTACAGAAPRLWLGQLPEPFADTAGRPDPGPPGRVAARRTDALHEVTRCGHRGRERGTRGHRRGTPDVHTRTLDTGRVDIARADTGRSHRTPDVWTLTEDADRVTKPRQASGHLRPRTSRRPTGRRTMFLWGQRLRRSAIMTARR